jgi:periplasmic protein TonB
MFENLVECSKNRKRGKSWVFFLLTSIVWTAALICSIICGIFFYDAKLDEQLFLVTILDPLPPPPPPPFGPGKQAGAKISHAIVAEVIQPAMTSVHKAPPMPVDLPLIKVNDKGVGDNFPADGVPEGVVNGVKDGVRDGVLYSTGPVTANVPPPPPQQVDPPTPTSQPQKPTPVKVSEGVIRGNALVRRTPDYPPLARTAGVQGDVQVEIIIGEDGSVVDAHIISGHRLLQQTALQAARQWRFNPTMLNKVPVKVQGILTFRFTL